MPTDLFARIRENAPALSKGQRAIATFISEHYDKAAYMTAHRMGETVGVSESTIVRFATELGYEGYPQMQKALREAIRATLTSVQRIELGRDRLGSGDLLKRALMSDLENLRSTMDSIDPETFAGAVEAILSARDIYIVGARSSAALVSFLAFYLNLIFPNVRLAGSASDSDMFERVMRIGPEDALIGISFPRYSRRTVQTMRYAHDRGARVIALTDSPQSPLAETAGLTLLARSDMVSFVDSLVSPLAVINALIVALGMRRGEDVAKTFTDLERIWDEYEIYEKHR
ncbi:MAG: MurR/RpiR family transcriptional regulator [Oscillospiraceae bacterium]|jgi:DNA-binding MurR/RpiR family transcriptional regulator|nr:MurR/RpiR family transcriptional regulator [Oscillospiraceae bacterium]